MKKVISVLLAIALCFSLTACGGGVAAHDDSKAVFDPSKAAFDASKAAYDKIDVAYEITDRFGSDLYEAWRLGIYEKDEILYDGADYLAMELSLSADEIRTGAAYTIATMVGEDWEEMSDDDKSEYIDMADGYFSLMEDDLFSFCIMCVTGAYTINGKVNEARTALDDAKEKMKELSQDYSDYEHYPSLKGYYTTTSSFFEYCNNPTGSFEQVKETINDYRNEARNYVSDLDYIFEE